MRIVHFGLGAFHRAHQAVYTEAAGDTIVAVAPHSRSIVDAMRAQNCRYTVSDRVPGPLHPREVGSIVEALHMPTDADRVVDLVARTTVVTLTITEKAYHHRGTVIAMLAHCLAERRRRSGAPLSVVSCDNMAANGRVLAGVVREAVAASTWPDRDDLLDWLATSVTFPSTVVDRIVPATTPDDVAAVEAALGRRDEIPVLGEPYSGWILEDAFAAPRPEWELGGARIVPDATPYQLRKLRLLNGSHSAMAYLGAAAGCETVADVLATEWGERLVRGYCAEVAPGESSYVDNLVERFGNPAIRHSLSQIGADGSLKIAHRWFDPLRENAAGSTPILALALAGWVHATRRPPQDLAADRLTAAWQNKTITATVVELLTIAGAPDLAEREDLVAAVVSRLPALAAGRVEF